MKFLAISQNYLLVIEVRLIKGCFENQIQTYYLVKGVRVVKLFDVSFFEELEFDTLGSFGLGVGV